MRWRQLVELAGRADDQSDPRLLDQAIAEIRAGSALVDERVRIAAALAVATLPIPSALVATFASDRLGVAAPVLASARLTAAEWTSVSEAASDGCRLFIATMRSHQPAPPASTALHSEPEPVPSIRDVIDRIERLREHRDGESPETAPPPLAAEPPRLFQWECNESGAIDWVEGAPRGAIVGQSIAQRGLDDGVDGAVERAFASRAPFHEGLLQLAAQSSSGGAWKISGIPAFDRSSGRFAGYRGVAERASPGPNFNPDSLRELAHEIRTPLTAIIGFAEIISGEYLGPAETRYRERAGEIVGQAQLLLTAIEDLDFAARLRSAGPDSTSASNASLAESLAASWDDIERQAAERGVRVNVAPGDERTGCALSPELAQRLVQRFCGAVVGCETQGAILTFSLGSDQKSCTLAVDRPSSLPTGDLDSAHSRQSNDPDTLPIRLVVGLARAAGGSLDTGGDRLVLRLPRA